MGRQAINGLAIGGQAMLLFSLLAKPQQMADLDLNTWDLLIRQARNADLLGRVYELVAEYQLFDDIPLPVRPHLLSARRVARRHSTMVGFELGNLLGILAKLDSPVVVLKGAAYVLAGLPAAAGRVFSDIDLMVAKDRLAEAEKLLKVQAWVSSAEGYDDKYYRQWMHELPPLQHMKRHTLLDLHHAILPQTARLKPSSERLFASALAVDGYPNAHVLCPEDMVLHSATHLFQDDEFKHGTRDLVDLDILLRHFGEDEQFWQRLVPRGIEMDLSRPLYYALCFCCRMLETPVPEAVLAQAAQAGRPPWLLTGLMDQLFKRALVPDHSSCLDSFSSLAKSMLFVRSHYLRMPFHLLIPHLFHKAFISPISARRVERAAENRPTIDALIAENKPG